MRVITRNFSTFYDMQTKVQFVSTLDRQSGTYVGVAETDEETAEKFEGRRGFKVLTDDEFLAMISKPVKPAEELTGDPLADSKGAKTKKAGTGQPAVKPIGPPPPPPG